MSNQEEDNIGNNNNEDNKVTFEEYILNLFEADDSEAISKEDLLKELEELVKDYQSEEVQEKIDFIFNDSTIVTVEELKEKWALLNKREGEEGEDQKEEENPNTNIENVENLKEDNIQAEKDNNEEEKKENLMEDKKNVEEEKENIKIEENNNEEEKENPSEEKEIPSSEKENIKIEEEKEIPSSESKNKEESMNIKEIETEDKKENKDDFFGIHENLTKTEGHKKLQFKDLLNTKSIFQPPKTNKIKLEDLDLLTQDIPVNKKDRPPNFLETLKYDMGSNYMDQAIEQRKKDESFVKPTNDFAILTKNREEKKERQKKSFIPQTEEKKNISFLERNQKENKFTNDLFPVNKKKFSFEGISKNTNINKNTFGLKKEDKAPTQKEDFFLTLLSSNQGKSRVLNQLQNKVSRLGFLDTSSNQRTENTKDYKGYSQTETNPRREFDMNSYKKRNTNIKEVGDNSNSLNLLSKFQMELIGKNEKPGQIKMGITPNKFEFKESGEKRQNFLSLQNEINEYNTNKAPSVKKSKEQTKSEINELDTKFQELLNKVNEMKEKDNNILISNDIGPSNFMPEEDQEIGGNNLNEDAGNNLNQNNPEDMVNFEVSPRKEENKTEEES